MIFVFAHPKGGVGKSTLAFNFFAWLKYEKKVNAVLVDIDGQNSISKINEIRQDNEKDVFDIKIANNYSHQGIIDLCNQLISENKIIVVDTGGFDSTLNRVVVALGDMIIIPLNDSPMEMVRLSDFNKILEEINATIGRKVTAKIVFNRIHPNTTSVGLSSLYNYCKEFNNFSFLDDSIIRERKVFKTALFDGSSIFETKDENAINEVTRFCEEIYKNINLGENNE